MCQIAGSICHLRVCMWEVSQACARVLYGHNDVIAVITWAADSHRPAEECNVSDRKIEQSMLSQMHYVLFWSTVTISEYTTSCKRAVKISPNRLADKFACRCLTGHELRQHASDPITCAICTQRLAEASCMAAGQVMLPMQCCCPARL